jgi:hypothetical protein
MTCEEEADTIEIDPARWPGWVDNWFWTISEEDQVVDRTAKIPTGESAPTGDRVLAVARERLATRTEHPADTAPIRKLVEKRSP